MISDHSIDSHHSVELNVLSHYIQMKVRQDHVIAAASAACQRATMSVNGLAALLEQQFIRLFLSIPPCYDEVETNANKDGVAATRTKNNMRHQHFPASLVRPFLCGLAKGGSCLLTHDCV